MADQLPARLGTYYKATVPETLYLAERRATTASSLNSVGRVTGICLRISKLTAFPLLSHCGKDRGTGEQRSKDAAGIRPAHRGFLMRAGPGRRRCSSWHPAPNAPRSQCLPTVGNLGPFFSRVSGQVNVAPERGDGVFVPVDGVLGDIGYGILGQGRKIDDGLFAAAPVQAGQARLAAVAAEPELFFIQIEKRGKELLSAFQALEIVAAI